MSSLTVVEVTPDNIDAAVKLQLAPGQERFVAPVATSLAEAYVTPTAWPRLVLDGDEVVGFIMGNFDPESAVPEFRAGIWRLNVAAHAQRRGVGRFAVDALEAEARRRGVERITVLWEEGEDGPEEFYLRIGFEPTGEKLLGEIVGAKVVAAKVVGTEHPLAAEAVEAPEPVSRVTIQNAILATPLTVARLETRRIFIQPGVAAGLHVHNGPVVGSIERGSAVYQLEGEEQQVLTPGDVFFEPEGERIARFDGGPDGVTFLATFALPPGAEATITFPEEAR